MEGVTQHKEDGLHHSSRVPSPRGVGGPQLAQHPVQGEQSRPCQHQTERRRTANENPNNWLKRAPQRIWPADSEHSTLTSAAPGVQEVLYTPGIRPIIHDGTSASECTKRVIASISPVIPSRITRSPLPL